MINIKGLNKGAVLAALYNKTHPQGLGILHFNSKEMTAEEGTELLKKQTYFDYLKGRVMKVDLSKDEFDSYLFDRDNYFGAAQNAIEKLRNTATE